VQIVFADGGDRRRELDVRVNNPSATVDDLARALDPVSGEERPLVIGGRLADRDFALVEAGLHEGAVVGFADPPPRTPGQVPSLADRLGPPVRSDVDDGGAPGPDAGAVAGAPPPRSVAGVPPPGPDLGAVAATPPPRSVVGAVASAPPIRELVVVGGLDAGRRFPLAPGTAVVGRAAGCEIVLGDTTLSRRHARFDVTATGEVTIADLDSHNGTWVGDRPVVDPEPLADDVTVRLGALDVEVRRPRADDRPVATDPLRHTTGAGTIPFNRPPRPAPAAPPAELRCPKPPQANQAKVPFSILSTVTPLLLAGAMFAISRSPQMLMFAGLTPIMGVANVVDGRRKGRRSDRKERARFARDLDEFRDRLRAHTDEERHRRESACPDPAEIIRRAAAPSTALWERRPGHGDFLFLRAGVGDVRWSPPIAGAGVTTEVPPELQALLDEATALPEGPIGVDLSGGGVVGIVGERAGCLALARSLLCQAATLHGPADLPIMVLASAEGAADWDWSKWLPHTRDPSGASRRLAGNPELSTRMVEARVKAAAPRDRAERPPPGPRPAGPTLLVVVDDETLTEGRRSPTRALLRGEAGLVAGIVVASTVDRLPAVCTTVVELADPDGGADLTLPQQGERVVGFQPAGMAEDVARGCARALARFEDPELEIVGAGLPDTIRLLPLLDLEQPTPEAVLARWRAGGPDPRPAAPVGVCEDGVFSVDFVADGPHGLVGGTTGAGKSELLRTLVASLSASVDPDHLTFVLIDFKGGSAFDECARLPHTVGMVTDLDEHLAERALRCLDAELRFRERLLRDAGAIDLSDYLRKGADQALPRLLVIIDEFARLRAELPDFIDALVGVAQRGRSLGVHMLLATQRPQGAINDTIKANTNLRIALRVQEANDSRDVIDVSDAAAIPRGAPGRAYVRLGPNEVVAIQSALSTGARGEAALTPVDVAPFVFGPEPRLPTPAPPGPAAGPAGSGDDPGGPGEPGGEVTDLTLLVGAIEGAFARTCRPPPRRPWPDPLPGDVDLDVMIGAATGPDGGPPAVTPVALADDPEAQTQYPVGWNRGEGNLIVYGLTGSGTTTTLASLALALARTCGPDELHLYALDFGAGELTALAPLPHVGGVIVAGERERQTRLIRMLRAELDHRREMGAGAVRSEPAVVTLVDGWSTFVAEYNDLGGTALWEAFTRVFADGPEVGLYTIVAAERSSAVTGALASLVRQRWAHRLADRSDYGVLGIRGSAVPDMVPGRALVGGTGQVLQVARPVDGVAAAAVRIGACWPPGSRPPVRIDMLATRLRIDDLGARAQLDVRPWTVPIGMAERTRAPAALVAYQGEHALITGPARSGRSTALLTVAAACRACCPRIRVVAVAGPRSPLATDPLVDVAVPSGQIGERLADLASPAAPGDTAAAGRDPRVLVLVDDAEAIEDVGGVLERLATADRPDLLFVAAGRNDGVRTGYSHWTRPLRRSKLGVLLRPDVDLDGDILGASIPRRAPVAMVAGRGYIAAGGDVELVQVAVPR
jgi:S-DNA-T family DNA segregation ATPase FtsK/SpoIIIE